MDYFALEKLVIRSTFIFRNIFSRFVWSPVQLPKRNPQKLELVHLNFGAPLQK